MKRAAAVSEFTVCARQLGGFSIVDRRGHFRIAVPTRQAADDWIIAQAKVKRSWSDVAGSHAAHVVGMGEL